MFENPDYQVDEQSEEFRLLNPIVSKVGQKRKKKLRLLAQQAAASEQVKLNLAVSYTLCAGMETFCLLTFKNTSVWVTDIGLELPSFQLLPHEKGTSLRSLRFGSKGSSTTK